ncbi:hypothetical protein CAAN1_24S00122 [[Candida] anglica]|uniref:Ketopantoate reductase C-terminal domain-containing protein n=1 Tax=[Candida] anglica TaxID=148631 RepID=A0ABP0EDR5_9ASCO
MPKALFLGDSPSIAFLVWNLSSLGWWISVVPSMTSNNYQGNKLTFKSHSGSTTIKPQVYSQSVESLIRILPGGIKFDFLFLSSYVANTFGNYKNTIEKFLNSETLIIVDASILSTAHISQQFPHHSSLYMYSEVDCRKLDDTSYQLFNSDMDYYIGSTGTGNTKSPFMRHGLIWVLKDNFETLNCGTVHLTSPRHVKSLIWKYLSCMISIESVCIVYDEPNVLDLIKDCSSWPIIKGLFKELTMIAEKGKFLSSSPRSILTTKSMNKIHKKDLRSLLMKVAQKSKDRSEVDSESILPQYIHSPKMFYDFSRDGGDPMDIPYILLTLLELADSLKVQVPFLESFYGIMNRLISIRGDQLRGQSKSKLFNWKDRHNSSPYIVNQYVNGIEPECNMMNYPPFNPLPQPSIPSQFYQNPIVYMCSVKVDDDSIEETIDPSLQELVSGTEELTYGEEIQMKEEFHDALESDDLNEATPSDLPITASVQTSPPQMQGITPIVLPNGGIYYPPPGGSSNVIKKAERSFYHSPKLINKNSSTKQLYESHTQLMESVQFNSFIEKSTGSRYGQFDTSSVILKSAGNSSKGSKISTPSRGSSRLELAQRQEINMEETSVEEE